MPRKVLIIHSGAKKLSLADLGSFDSRYIPIECRPYCIELAKCGEFDIFFSNSSISNHIITLSFEPQIIGTMNVEHGTPDPAFVREYLLARKNELLSSSKPVRSDQPYVPSWINECLSNAFLRSTSFREGSIEMGHDLIEVAKTFHFSTFGLTQYQLCGLVYVILMEYEKSLFLDSERLKHFVMTVMFNYRANSYHNFRHAVDVMQSVWIFLESIKEECHFSPLERFSLLIAAFAHDIGHFGFKNKFVIESGHPLTLIYHDRSPVENYHCLVLFSLLEDQQHQFFLNWDGTMRKEFRRIVISVILATDMLFHFEYVQKFQNCHVCQRSSTCSSHRAVLSGVPDQKLLDMIMLIKAADLSNVIRPFEISEKWGCCLQAEFYHQVFIFCV